MTGCLVRTFGGEIPHVPGTVIKNTCLIALWLLSLQLWLFTASHSQVLYHRTNWILKLIHAYGKPE